jgi:hypothetical protein
MTDQMLGSSIASPPDDEQLEPSLSGPAPAGVVRLERPARVLLGWLPPSAANSSWCRTGPVSN